MVDTIAPTCGNQIYLNLTVRLAELKRNFLDQKTKSRSWREDQLKAYLKGCREMRKDFEDAIEKDLGKCAQSSITELFIVMAAAEHDLKHLKEYMQDVKEETELLLAPASTIVRYEPMGVCAIFSAWNYPILTAFKPLV